jgi:hypothetical protein
MDMVNHNKGLNSTTDKYTWATNIGLWIIRPPVRTWERRSRTRYRRRS